MNAAPHIPVTSEQPERAAEDRLDRSSGAAAQNAVATAFPAATDAAIEMLRRGGNAVDAAAAAAWALAVCEPSGSGLGGQAALLIHFPNQEDAVALDGHSHGPEHLSRKQVSRAEQRRGPRATTIPSMPATIGAALQRYGRLSLETTLEPARRLAEEGFPVSKLLRRHISWCRGSLSSSPLTARVFLPNGKLPRVGTMLVQPELAATLRRLAAHGVDDFYRGALARDIARDMEAQGGLIAESDLQNSAMPVTRKPISIRYREHEVMSIPPPGGGLSLLLGLRLAEALDLRSLASDEVGWAELMAVLVETIFRERGRWPVDPRHTPESLLTWLLSDARVEEIAAEVRGSTRRPPVRSAEGPGDTTHLAVVDRDGMVVSLTQSVQSLFGAKVANEKLGFLYNNYLCTCPRYRHPSQLRPNAMPQSNAAPTILFDRDATGARRPWLALGAAGSRRITSSILQVITHMVDGRRSLVEAIDAPRIHTTLGGRPMVEKRLATPELGSRLATRYRPPTIKAARSYAMGAVQAVTRVDGGWIGAADPRREGTARGC